MRGKKPSNKKWSKKCFKKSRSLFWSSHHSHLCCLIYSMLPSHIQWRSFQVIFKEFDVDESGTISMEELREMTHYLGFMPTRLMLEDSRTAYFDRILLECGWGFKKDGVSFLQWKKKISLLQRYVKQSPCEINQSSKQKDRSQLQNAFAVDMNPHVFSPSFAKITPDRNDLSLVFRSKAIHHNLPYGQKFFTVYDNHL